MRAERALLNRCEFDVEMRDIHEYVPHREALAPGDAPRCGGPQRTHSAAKRFLSKPTATLIGPITRTAIMSLAAQSFGPSRAPNPFATMSPGAASAWALGTVGDAAGRLHSPAATLRAPHSHDGDQSALMRAFVDFLAAALGKSRHGISGAKLPARKATLLALDRSEMVGASSTKSRRSCSKTQADTPCPRLSDRTRHPHHHVSTYIQTLTRTILFGNAIMRAFGQWRVLTIYTYVSLDFIR